ncbi:MAG: phospholipase D family protein [Nitrososphaeria archaeon]|nr:phospholipase D family protein [Nitrososphaeria archaeon]
MSYCDNYATVTSSTAYTQSETITITSTEATTVTEKVFQTGSSVQVLGTYFSPNGGCAEQIIYWIGRANTSIHVLIYSFTLQNIADALIDAKNRGVDVKVVFEKGQISKYSQYFRLASAGVSVRNDTNPDYMHNKVAIIDGIIVLTGSYNWSSSAENSNNENLIIVKSADVAREYENVFNRIWENGR